MSTHRGAIEKKTLDQDSNSKTSQKPGVKYVMRRLKANACTRMTTRRVGGGDCWKKEKGRMKSRESS